MILNPPTSVAFNILGLDIYFYGIFMASAVFAGFYGAYQVYKKYYDIKFAQKFFDFSPFLIIFGILGARFYYCTLNYSYYLTHPLEILNLRQGGLSIHGMLIFGILGLYFVAKHYKTDFLKLTDSFLCSIPLAQSIGRWGNFFNSEAFGKPVENSFLKLYVPISNRPSGFEGNEFFHPTFLYESILDFLIFLILLLLFKKFSKKSGKITALYLILYGIVRFFIEGIRIDSALNINSVPIAQIASVTLIIIGLVLWLNLDRKNKKL